MPAPPHSIHSLHEAAQSYEQSFGCVNAMSRGSCQCTPLSAAPHSAACPALPLSVPFTRCFAAPYYVGGTAFSRNPPMNENVRDETEPGTEWLTLVYVVAAHPNNYARGLSAAVVRGGD